MNKSLAAIILILFLTVVLKLSSAVAEDRDWHFNLNIAYTSRTLDGMIVDKRAITNDAFGSLIATGDSMNVGSSDGLMLAAGAQYKKWGFGLNYMPTSFSGTGSAVVELGGGGGGVVVKTPLNTDIEVNMLLANVSYNFIQNRNMVFGVGVGFGQTSIDLKVIPDVGNSIVYEGEQPFGFLNVHMSNNYKRFLYGFSLNGISGNFGGAEVDYSDYKVDLGYRVMDKKVKCDLIGGYRMVNFAIDLEYGQNVVTADITLKGPFLGVNFVY